MSYEAQDSVETPIDALDPLSIFPSETDVAPRPRRSEPVPEKPAVPPSRQKARRPGLAEFIAHVRWRTRLAFAYELDEARFIVRSMRSNLARLATGKTPSGF